MASAGYHETRLSSDPKRRVLWRVLTRYIQRYVDEDAVLLDFGAGYCDFTNLITAREKYAYDIWDGIAEFCGPSVKPLIESENDYEKLRELKSESVDVVFASNIFEHFSVDELKVVVEVLRSKLKVGGRLILLQPNFCYSYKNYFDDYTHKSIWTHLSLSDFIESNGFDVEDVKAKFLPLTVKSKLPVHPFLIECYLRSPFKPFSGQMLVTAIKK